MKVLTPRRKADGSNAYLRAEGKELGPDARKGHPDTLILDRIKKIKTEFLALPVKGKADDYDRKEKGVAGWTENNHTLLTQGDYSIPLLLPERCSEMSRLLDTIIFGDRDKSSLSRSSREEIERYRSFRSTTKDNKKGEKDAVKDSQKRQWRLPNYL